MKRSIAMILALLMVMTLVLSGCGGGQAAPAAEASAEEAAPAEAAPVEEAKAEGINVTGPIPPDSLFGKVLNGQYDGAIAMYHDQGHIAAKIGHMSDCVNCTIGLPIIRTSVDHGTAFDIAGKGIAGGENMIQAMKVAEEFLKGKA